MLGEDIFKCLKSTWFFFLFRQELVSIRWHK